MMASRMYTTSFFDVAIGLEAHLSFIPWSSFGITMEEVTPRLLTEFAIAGLSDPSVFLPSDPSSGQPLLRIMTWADSPSAQGASQQRARDFLASVAGVVIMGSPNPTRFESLDEAHRRFIDELAHSEIYVAESSPAKITTWAALHLASLGFGLSSEEVIYPQLPDAEVVYVCASEELKPDELVDDENLLAGAGLGIVATVGGAMMVEVSKQAGTDVYSGMKRVVNRFRDSERKAEAIEEQRQRELANVRKIVERIGVQVKAGEIDVEAAKSMEEALWEDIHRQHAGLQPRSNNTRA